MGHVHRWKLAVASVCAVYGGEAAGADLGRAGRAADSGAPSASSLTRDISRNILINYVTS